MVEMLLVIVLVAGAGVYLVWHLVRGKPACHKGCAGCSACAVQHNARTLEPYAPGVKETLSSVAENEYTQRMHTQSADSSEGMPQQGQKQ